MMEQRANPRHRTFFKAVLAFNNGNSSEDGLVRNLGDDGALIELAYPYAPETFELLIPARNLRRSARTIWRSGERIGVRFEGEAQRAPQAFALTG